MISIRIMKDFKQATAATLQVKRNLDLNLISDLMQNFLYRENLMFGFDLIWVLNHINHFKSFNAKSSLYIYILNMISKHIL